MSPPNSDQTYGRDPALTALGGPLAHRIERILHNTSRVNGEPDYSISSAAASRISPPSRSSTNSRRPQDPLDHQPPRTHRVDRSGPTTGQAVRGRHPDKPGRLKGDTL